MDTTRKSDSDQGRWGRLHLRLPRDLLDRLAASAADNQRSLTGETIVLLERALATREPNPS